MLGKPTFHLLVMTRRHMQQSALICVTKILHIIAGKQAKS